MPLPTGTFEVGPRHGDLHIGTTREGAAASVGHDLTLLAKRWRATLVLDEAPTRCHVSATVDARSLRVVDSSGGAIPLTAGQREEIERITRTQVLDADRHREISFVSSAVRATASGGRVRGDLTLAGVTRPVTVRVTITETDGGVHLHGTAAVTQTKHGIRPYSALMGALRVGDEVSISVDVLLDTR